MDLSLYWTPLVRSVLLGLAFVLVVQWGWGQQLVDMLAWHPWDSGFKPWQPLTSMVMAAPQISWMIFDWMMIFFTLGVVERALGRRALALALGFCWLLTVIGVLGLDLLGVVNPGVFAGQTIFCIALITLFCFEFPDQQILLFFFIPIRASWAGWGTGLLAAYAAAAYRDIGSLGSLFAWGGALIWSWWLGGGVRWFKLRWQRRQVEKRLSRFSVIEGGKGKSDDEWIN
jgi:hypothetical protein